MEWYVSFHRGMEALDERCAPVRVAVQIVEGSRAGIIDQECNAAEAVGKFQTTGIPVDTLEYTFVDLVGLVVDQGVVADHEQSHQ